MNTIWPSADDEVGLGNSESRMVTRVCLLAARCSKCGLHRCKKCKEDPRTNSRKLESDTHHKRSRPHKMAASMAIRTLAVFIVAQCTTAAVIAANKPNIIWIMAGARITAIHFI